MRRGTKFRETRTSAVEMLPGFSERRNISKKSNIGGKGMLFRYFEIVGMCSEMKVQCWFWRIFRFNTNKKIQIFHKQWEEFFF